MNVAFMTDKAVSATVTALVTSPLLVTSMLLQISPKQAQPFAFKANAFATVTQTPNIGNLLLKVCSLGWCTSKHKRCQRTEFQQLFRSSNAFRQTRTSWILQRKHFRNFTFCFATHTQNERRIPTCNSRIKTPY